MKTKIITIIIVICAYSNSIKAQLKVNTTGTVSVGGSGAPTSSNFNIGTSAYQCNFYSNANHPSGWGDANKIQVSRTDTKALTVYYNGQTRFYVLGDGTMYSNGVYLGSDIKLKENISEINGALDKVLKLHGVSYLYKQNQDVMIDTSIYNTREKNNSFYPQNRKKRIGLIAQDVEKVIPEIVMTMPDSTKLFFSLKR